jgi:ribonuclease Z
MNKIIMLGVGNGGTEQLYNTCFVIQNEKGNFLVDTGGSIEIIPRLRKVGVDYKSLRHIFISHSHTDHILGLFWFFKKISGEVIHGLIKDKINIYCNDVVYESIKIVADRILPKKLMDAIYCIVDFHILENGDKYTIYGNKYTFLDMKPKGTKLFGFQTTLNGKKFAFLGDETLNPELYENIKDFDYVMHEAFCLDSEEHIYHAYEKNHSTTKSVSEIMNTLGIKNLILYHTEESHKEKRKALYTKEAQDYFKGNVIVPDDLESFEIR